LKRKIETGEEITTAPLPEKGEVIDLMEALRRSLGKQAPASRKSAAAPVAERKPAKRAGSTGNQRKAAVRR